MKQEDFMGDFLIDVILISIKIVVKQIYISN